MTQPNQPSRFWLIPSALSARISVSPGCHAIVSLTESDTMVRLDDRELNDNEALREAIQAALDGWDPIGFQGSDASLTAAQAAADAAWDAEQDRAGLAPEVVPAWLSTLRAVGAL